MTGRAMRIASRGSAFGRNGAHWGGHDVEGDYLTVILPTIPG
jgi:hypothetical protein